MISEAKNVDQYISEVPEKRKEALSKLKNLCREHLQGFKESMAYKMPSYKRNDRVEVAFASQKNHICFYILVHEVMLANNDLLRGLNHGKGCIRFSNPAKIDYETIRKLLKDTYQSGGAPC